MNDIASRLLEMADSPDFEETPGGKLMFEGSREITRLRALVDELKADRIRTNDEAETEIASLREALEKLACRHVTVSPLWWQVEARKALEGGE